MLMRGMQRGGVCYAKEEQCKEEESVMLMPGSHWAFLASPMHSRWILTSIRRCSRGITEPSATNLLVFMLKIARHREASRV